MCPSHTSTLHGIQSTNQTGPNWLRQRALGKKQPKLQTSIESIKRLKLESILNGHSSCVNCLEWNTSGNLLASGSDDRNIIIWEPFEAVKKQVIPTGHVGNIFSVKFINDRLIATCADDGVKVIDNLTNLNVLNCISCNNSRVKRLVNHPNEPNLIWSASEDGCIRQYDIRERHNCDSSRKLNVILDLKTHDNSLVAKCLAINPIKDEMLAIGTNDVYIRLIDRRLIPQNNNAKNNSRSDDSCYITYFTPGHLSNCRKTSKLSQYSFGTTYLTFNQDGSELLANIHAEQIYLFNTYEPWERYKSFETTLKPLILDFPTPNLRPTKNNPALKPYCLWKSFDESIDLPKEHEEFYNGIMKKLKNKVDLDKQEYDEVNRLLTIHKNCAKLYQLRSSALLNRGWKGDHYQVLRDLCCAISLDGTSQPFIDGDDTNIERKDLMEAIRDDFEHSIACRQSAKFSLTHAIAAHQESMRRSEAYDYSKRFCGHCNMNTDIKEANFFGNNGEFIVGGSDDGAFYIWDKQTTNIVKAVKGDFQILNCLQPHPSICMLATSGIDPTVKIWSPSGKENHDIKSIESRCAQNQRFINSDPFEAMIMTLYPERDI